MYTFQVRFTTDNSNSSTTVTAKNANKAKAEVKRRYPSAKNIVAIKI